MRCGAVVWKSRVWVDVLCADMPKRPSAKYGRSAGCFLVVLMIQHVNHIETIIELERHPESAELIRGCLHKWRVITKMPS